MQPRRPKNAPRHPQDAPRRSQDAQEPLQDGSKSALEASGRLQVEFWSENGASEPQKPLFFKCFFCVCFFCFQPLQHQLRFGIDFGVGSILGPESRPRQPIARPRRSQDGSRWSQDGPRWRQDAPRMAPKRSEAVLRFIQGRSRIKIVTT